MKIQKIPKLFKNIKSKHALEILKEGLEAAKPETFMKKYLSKNNVHLGKKTIQMNSYQNLYLVSLGKAADSMAKVANSFLRIKKGIIIMPQGSKSVISTKNLDVFYSSHPIPSKKSQKAGRLVLAFLENLQQNDFVLFLISGGGSALVSLPDGISLKDKIKTNELLLKSGANIQEINCVRKHLSKIKGGNLVRNIPCKGAALLMSDVQNDDMSSISSGPTFFDDTTFKNALGVIKKYHLATKIPKSVLKRLHNGTKGKIPETPKKLTIPNKIIANNKLCLDAMAKKAKKLGYSPKTVQVFDDVNHVARKLVNLISQKKNSCIIFGGEPTVKVVGPGKGGRNQELVLQILKRLTSKSDLIISSIGTDGIDGNTKYAGAIINSTLDIKEIPSFLKKNNSNGFFKKYGGLIKTGNTHTNLMDIGIILQ